MSELLELAERCEKATGPAEAHALLLEAWAVCFPRSAFPTGAHRDNARWHFKRLLAVGAHLDAAMTLVPDGFNIQFERTGKASRACVWKAARNHSRYAATPALALCAAALRARAASVDRSGEAGETATQIAGSTEGESAVPCADTADAQITPGDSNG